MDNIIEFLKIGSWLLVIFLHCMWIKKINLSQEERVKQFLMPFIGCIYVIVVIFCVHKLRNILLNLIDWSIGQFIEVIDSFIRSVDWDTWIDFIICLLILLVFITIKGIAIAIMKKIVKLDNHLMEKISCNIYQYDSERGCWFLSEDRIETRKLFKVAYWSCLLISLILMTITKYLVEDGSLSYVFIPAYSIIMLGEMFFFIDGLTKKEFLKEVYDDENGVKVSVNYSLMRKVLNSLFKDNVASEGTSSNTSYQGLTAEQLLRKYEKSNDHKIRMFAKFFKKKVQKGLSLDQNYFQSSLELLQGKSILFNDPFYHDLIPYAFYPMQQSLLANKKVLVVLGRHGIEDDIVRWLEEGVKSVTNLPYFWKIGNLKEEGFDGNIGIINRSDVTDLQLMQDNEEFFEDVEFVFIIEPSKLITTAQIGLNLIIKKCRRKDREKKLVYCLTEKNCDGLVDAMSHILLNSISKVSATNKHKGTVSYMCWRSTDEYMHHKMIANISRYLGIGTELSFSALKNKIPQTKWYGGEMFPVVDMKWIVKQYYHDLAVYADLPSEQGLIDKKFVTSNGYWDAPISDESYLTVEDEVYNLFELVRDFSTRSISQGFVNVICPDYLLRDYMAWNFNIFLSDPKAIPNFVADYAKTNRNFALSMIFMMSDHPIYEKEIVDEFSLIGIKAINIKKQLWYEIYMCFTSTAIEKDLPSEYEKAVEEVSNRIIEKNGKEFDIDVISISQKYNFEEGKNDDLYSIDNKDFIEAFVSDLHLASYVAEDEYEKGNYLGTELVSQVFQKTLPGQFITRCGKYYQMVRLSAQNEIILRRSADHIDDRYEYRQIRDYGFESFAKSTKGKDSKQINQITLGSEYADFTVKTQGYYKMKHYNKINESTLVLFDTDNESVPERHYVNKRILTLSFDQSAEYKENANISYTICLLMNEIFRTMFAQDSAYIVALTSFQTDEDHESLTFVPYEENGPLTYMIYDVSEQKDILKENAIYIVEDSQLDIGLIETVERNIDRILEIICDYLDWYLEMKDKAENGNIDLEEETLIEPVNISRPKQPKKKSFFDKFKEKQSKKDNAESSEEIDPSKQDIEKINDSVQEQSEQNRSKQETGKTEKEQPLNSDKEFIDESEEHSTSKEMENETNSIEQVKVDELNSVVDDKEVSDDGTE